MLREVVPKRWRSCLQRPQDTGLASALLFSLRCNLQGLAVELGFVPFVSWPFDWPCCWWCWIVWGIEPTSHKDIKLLTKPMLLAQTRRSNIPVAIRDGHFHKDFLTVCSGSIFLMSQLFILGGSSLPFPCLDAQVANTRGKCLGENCSYKIDQMNVLWTSRRPFPKELLNTGQEEAQYTKGGIRLLHLEGDTVVPPCPRRFLALGMRLCASHNPLSPPACTERDNIFSKTISVLNKPPQSAILCQREHL